MNRILSAWRNRPASLIRPARSVRHIGSGIRGFIEELEGRLVLSPVIAPLDQINGGNTIIRIPVGKTFQLPIDGSDTVDPGATLSFSIVNNSNSAGVSTQFASTTNSSVRMTVTGQGFSGDLTFQIFEDLTPITAARFIAIASGQVSGVSLNNLSFHRVIQNFVAQGGDPNCGSTGSGVNCGSGGTGTDYADEFTSQLTFTGFGQVANANAGDDDNDMQFFFTDVDLGVGNANSALRPPQHLNFNHTIFGQLTDGFSILAQLIATPVDQDGTSNTADDTRPTTPVVISNVTVFQDHQNGVLRLTALGAAGSTSTITVRATNTLTNETFDRVFTVNVVPDTDSGRSDGTATDDRAFLTVPPSAFPNLQSILTTNEDTPITIKAEDLETTGNLTVHIRTGSVSDATNATINTDNVANLTVSIDQVTRTITIMPAANFNGVIDFLLAVRDATLRDANGDNIVNSQDSPDARAQYDTQRIQLTINAVNDAPTTQAASGLYVFGTDTNLQLTSTDGDPLPSENQTVTFSIVVEPEHGTVSLNSTTGAVTYTPTSPRFKGRDSFRFVAMDNGGTANGGVDTSLPTTVTLDFDAADARLVRGQLIIVGGAVDDEIDVAFDANGAGTDDDEIVVTVNGRTLDPFTNSDVRHISIRSFGGDDTISMDVEIDQPTRVDAGTGNDDVSAGDGNTTIVAGMGDDTIDSGNGKNVVLGGKGVDDISAGEDKDTIRGGRGDDSLDAGASQDKIFGGRGDDTMNGGDGDDTMRGGVGGDDMSGEEGDDHMFGRTGDDTMDGAEGDDTLRGSYGSDSLTGGDGDDKLIGGRNFQGSAERIDGSDTLEGDDGDDLLRGGASADDLDGGAGEDTLQGQQGDDTETRNFEDAGVRGVATYELPGAPLTSPLCPGPDGTPGTTDDSELISDSCHVDSPVDYAAAGFTNPPTYGPHYARTSSSTDLGAPVQPTGIHDQEIDDGDIVHNLEHGHVWISYDPAQLTVKQVNRLKAIVRDLSGEADGSGAGILLTQRTANDDKHPIAVASWGRLVRMDHVDGDRIREIHNTNKGLAPEGFETP